MTETSSSEPSICVLRCTFVESAAHQHQETNKTKVRSRRTACNGLLNANNLSPTSVATKALCNGWHGCHGSQAEKNLLGARCGSARSGTSRSRRRLWSSQPEELRGGA